MFCVMDLCCRSGDGASTSGPLLGIKKTDGGTEVVGLTKIAIVTGEL